MKVVLSHPDALVAQAARDHLISHGILAAVVTRTEGMHAAITGYEVLLCFGKQADAAQGLLADGSWRPQSLGEGGWDHADAAPDLSRLDAVFAPECPGCLAPLPLDATLEACPACGGPVDVAELIAQIHGPEALEACYEPPEPILAERAIGELRLLCPGCQYSLDGQARTGVCQECGRPFDKEMIVREFLRR